jgi:hypothetical protein
MFRQCLFLGSGVLVFLGMLGAPGQLAAQHSRGGANHGFHSSQNGFNPRFNSRFFDPRFSRGRFDRFEDRFEDRFRFGGFDPRFAGGFGLGFGFTPGFASGFVPGFGFAPGFFGPVFP